MKEYSLKRDAWRGQRYAAYRRKIEFGLTFEDWVRWWENNLGPNWFKKRGKGRGKYVMARFGDKGPYKVGNIKCILGTENVREMSRPIGFCGKISPEIATEIYEMNGCMAAMTQKYKVGYHAVYDLRNGRSWVKLTKELSRGNDCPCSNGEPCRLGLARLARTT